MTVAGAGRRRQNGSAASTMATPASPATTNAHCGPIPSMTTPAMGAEAAPPISRAVPWKPIASPLASLGTHRVSTSTVADRDGAQSSPAGSSARISQCHPPPTSATGTVARPIAAIRVRGDRPLDRPPYTKPPMSEKTHQMATASPTHAVWLAWFMVATRDSSVAVSTNVAAAAVPSSATKAGVSH